MGGRFRKSSENKSGKAKNARTQFFETIARLSIVATDAFAPAKTHSVVNVFV